MEMWELQISPEESLYFGHPYSKDTYTNSFQLRSIVTKWIADLSKLYDGAVIEFKCEDSELLENLPECYDEERVVRGTKVLFIGGADTCSDLQEDLDIYHNWTNAADVKVANPDYLDFNDYTDVILGNRLPSLEALDSLDPEMAKKYMEYAVLYDKDKQHSNKLILKPYFYSTDSGILIKTEDFQDFVFKLKISPELGVVGFTVQMCENTSHYLYNYKEI